MNKRDYYAFPFIDCGLIKKTKGLVGEVIVQTSNDLISCFYEGLNLYFVPPQNDLIRSAHISELTVASDTTLQVVFSEIADMDTAKRLKGLHLIANRGDLNISDYDICNNYLNRCCIDINYGDLGIVSEYIENPANPVLVINGQYGEILVSINQETIIEIPDDLNLPLVLCVPIGTIKEV